MSIDKSSINYAVQRVHAIANRKVQELRNEPNVNKQIEAFVEDVKAGKARVRARAATQYRGYYLSDMTLGSLFVLNDYVKEEKDGENIKREKAIRAEADKLCDQLMLGDAKEALELIKAFEAF